MINAPPLPRLSAPELIDADLPVSTPILAPILASKSLVLLYGPRGLGKTFVALGIARAAALGESFLGWQASRPHKVLYVDGEMAAADMRQRLLRFGPVPRSLDFILADLNRGPLLDLAHAESQFRLMQSWGHPELVVLDNLASLAGLKSGDPDRWHELQRFLMQQRQFGRAVLMVHHANKQGLQRGSSRREDVMDLVMAMRRPAEWTPADGTCFEIHFEKARSLHSDAIAPIHARLRPSEESLHWEFGPAEDPVLTQAAALFKAGSTVREVSATLGISRSAAHRMRLRTGSSGRPAFPEAGASA